MNVLDIDDICVNKIAAAGIATRHRCGQSRQPGQLVGV